MHRGIRITGNFKFLDLFNEILSPSFAHCDFHFLIWEVLLRMQRASQLRLICEEMLHR